MKIFKYKISILFFVFYMFFPPQWGAGGAPFPSWIFSPWVWENEGTTQSARQLVDDYLAHNIPVGAIIIDSPWETGYNTFEFDTALYPDAQQMIDYFHSKNVRVFLWITTMINIDVPLWSYADSMGYFMCANDTSGSTVINWWKGDGSSVDFFNPAAAAWWKSLMDKALAMGIDGWKCDGTDFSVGQYAPYSPYLGTTVTRPAYSDQYYRIFHDYSRQVLGNDRVITARPIDNYGYDVGGAFVAFAPVDITWCGWVGDQDATFDGLKKALNNMYHSSQYGYLSFGSDIGGFRFDNNYPVTGRSKEVFTRWAQLGAFCPVMENGGNGEHRPWMFDAQTNTIYKTFADLHLRMTSYFMEQGDTAFQQGKSLMTFFNKTDYSYLLGTDIFIAPVLDSASSFNISFPAGNNWIYLFDTAQKYSGGQTAQLSFSLDEFPVFVAEGSPLLDTLLGGTPPLLIAATALTVNIYPNPCTGVLHIANSENMIENIKIFNVFGKNVYETTVADKPEKCKQLLIDLSSQPEGIYFLKLINEDGVLMRKIIKE